MVRTILTTDAPGAGAPAYTTSAFTPGANRLVLAFIANTGLPAASLPSLSGNGLDWVQVETRELTSPLIRHRLSCFRAIGAAPSPGSLTIDFGGQQQLSCAWSVFEYDGVDIAGAVLQVRALSGQGQALSHAFGPLADPAKSIIAGGIILSVSTQINSSPGFQQIYQQVYPNGTMQTQDQTGAATISWNWADLSDAVAIVLEVKAAATIAPDIEALVRRFEPVLVFHPDEKFFPSDAKRYVEHCALWNAKDPFDQKGLWTRILKQSDIAAIAGEPGQSLASNLLINSPDDQFFELTGWKKADGTPQPNVTDQSENTYSNRDKIATLYNNSDNEGGNAKLRDSRFWYHAEFFDNDRVRKLLSTVPAPDLVRALDSVKNAALLNYYFFFPAHEEALADDCTNIEAKEYLCFAGDWACLSVLLTRDDPSQKFQPKSIGHTGRWAKDEATGGIKPGQVTDDEDPAHRIVMKLSEFKDAQRIGEHPKLFVCKGTHSLELTPGPHNVAYRDSVYECGRVEIREPISGGGITAGDIAEGWLVLEAKLIASGLLNLGPLSLVVGAIWAIGELDSPESPTGLAGNARPDETVSPGATAGKIVRPKDLTVPDAGPDVENWRSVQGLPIAGRRHDFLVDRATQFWWPREDVDEQGPGYRGRWGPRVEKDPLSRRAGMRFPPFWEMFFKALAGRDTD